MHVVIDPPLFGLRTATGDQTLEDLLGDEGALNGEIGGAFTVRLEDRGLVVEEVILRGEMKSVRNEVL